MIALLLAVSTTWGADAVPSEKPETPTPRVDITLDDKGHVIRKSIGTSPDNLQVWNYEYDQAGLLVRETEPTGHTKLYAYDDHGRITTMIRHVDATDQKIVVTYDDNGIITGVTVDGASIALPKPPAWKDHDLYEGDERVY